MNQISNDELNRLMEDFDEDETPTQKPKRRRKLDDDNMRISDGSALLHQLDQLLDRRHREV